MCLRCHSCIFVSDSHPLILPDGPALPAPRMVTRAGSVSLFRIGWPRVIDYIDTSIPQYVHVRDRILLGTRPAFWIVPSPPAAHFVTNAPVSHRARHPTCTFLLISTHQRHPPPSLLRTPIRTAFVGSGSTAGGAGFPPVTHNFLFERRDAIHLSSGTRPTTFPLTPFDFSSTAVRGTTPQTVLGLLAPPPATPHRSSLCPIRHDSSNVHPRAPPPPPPPPPPSSFPPPDYLPRPQAPSE